MRVPVLIAARNEAQTIGRCLERLDRASVEPVVVSNGSTDATARIARSFGAVTFELEKAGKTPALQHGLRYLGERALGPVLYLDADSYPVFPKSWVSSMMRPAIETSRSAHVSGPFIYSPVFREGAVRYARQIVEIARVKRSGAETMTFGRNMLSIFGESEVLDNVLHMPNYWPGEDRAIRDACDVQLQTGSVHSTVVTSARRLKPLITRLRPNRGSSMTREYNDDDIDGAVEYISHWRSDA